MEAAITKEVDDVTAWAQNDDNKVTTQADDRKSLCATKFEILRSRGRIDFRRSAGERTVECNVVKNGEDSIEVGEIK